MVINQKVAVESKGLSWQSGLFVGSFVVSTMAKTGCIGTYNTIDRPAPKPRTFEALDVLCPKCSAACTAIMAGVGWSAVCPGCGELFLAAGAQ
jgi:hypothetical protein